MYEDFKDMTEYTIGRGCCGVYLLLYKEEVIYIGEAINIFIRVGTHLRRMKNSDRFKFDKVLVKFCNEEDRKNIEKELIKQYLPKFNGNLNQTKNSKKAKKAFPDREEWYPEISKPKEEGFKLSNEWNKPENFPKKIIA